MQCGSIRRLVHICYYLVIQAIIGTEVLMLLLAIQAIES